MLVTLSRCPTGAGRFLTIPEGAEELATSEAQISALVTRGDLVAIKIGGRGQWRIERNKLEKFIRPANDDTERELRERRETSTDDDSNDLD